MLFNSYGFIFCFLPLTLLGAFICKKIGERFRQKGSVDRLLGVSLLLVSLIFYGISYARFLPVLLVGMGINYLLGWKMEEALQKKKKKPLLIAGLVVNLGLLVLFKYLDGGNRMPPGLSFYTFTQIAFLMEVYRGNLKRVSIWEYGLCVAFFPKLMQGPIALPQEILPQFRKLGRRIEWETVYRCLALFVFGLFKKVILADTLGGAVDLGFANLGTLNTVDGIIVMLSYTLQLYFDFSGYCDMAMGIAGLFGVELPLNFDSPYKAANILEFWKGWHRTLTGFFTKYLYIPLGGNRKGKTRTYVNYFLVFFVSGLWHGTGWTFLIWGMLHGICYVFTRMWRDWAGQNSPVVKKRGIGHVLGVAGTFLFVNVAWVFFRAPSVREAWELLGTIVSGKFGRPNWELAGCFNLDEFWYVIKVLGVDGWQYAHYIWMVLILLALLLLVFFAENSVKVAKRIKPGVVQVLTLTVLFVWSVLSLSGVSSFLYVNF